MCQRTRAATPSPARIPRRIPYGHHHPQSGTPARAPGEKYNGTDCRNLIRRGTWKLGVNCEFSLGSDIDLTSEVDAEHTINAHDHIDRVTRALLCWIYDLLHLMGVLVRCRALLGRDGVANEFETHLEMKLHLKHTYPMFLYHLRSKITYTMFISMESAQFYLWLIYDDFQIAINKETWWCFKVHVKKSGWSLF